MVDGSFILDAGRTRHNAPCSEAEEEFNPYFDAMRGLTPFYAMLGKSPEDFNPFPDAMRGLTPFMVMPLANLVLLQELLDGAKKIS